MVHVDKADFNWEKDLIVAEIRPSSAHASSLGSQSRVQKEWISSRLKFSGNPNGDLIR